MFLKANPALGIIGLVHLRHGARESVFFQRWPVWGRHEIDRGDADRFGRLAEIVQARSGQTALAHGVIDAAIQLQSRVRRRSVEIERRGKTSGRGATGEGAQRRASGDESVHQMLAAMLTVLSPQPGRYSRRSRALAAGSLVMRPVAPSYSSRLPAR